MTAIKICGVTEPRTYDLLAELSVNWVGLVFYPHSPRYISADKARLLPDYKEHGLLRVGLFVHPTFDEVKQVLETVHLDILQLYTSFKEAELIQTACQLPVWVAKGIKTNEDLPSNCNVEGMVIEAPSDHLDTNPGGNGRIFDWKLTANWKSPKPWLLAGGLTPENVTQAVQQSGTQAVDVSSGVERFKGEKDSVLIRQFVENIRCFDLNSV